MNKKWEGNQCYYNVDTKQKNPVRISSPTNQRTTIPSQTSIKNRFLQLFTGKHQRKKDNRSLS